MLQQYLAVKKQHPDKIVLFRMGDFFEIFFEDAETAARLLKITLTSRNKKSDNAVPMCGFPHQAADGYIVTLVKAGCKVVVCDQVEDPKQAKGLVRREVTRIVTPGVNLDGDGLEADRDNFLAALAGNKPAAATGAAERYGLALLDASTGKFRVTELEDGEAVLDELGRNQPRELLLPAGLAASGMGRALRENFPDLHLTCRTESEIFSRQAAYERLCRQFGTLNLEGFGAETLTVGLSAAGAALAYVQETRAGSGGLTHITALKIFHRSRFMQLDRSVIINLELLCTIREQSRRGSLLGVLDRCRTSMGSRRLREWLLFPLLERKPIEHRYDAVEILLREKRCRIELQEFLKKLSDLDRLAGRLAAAKAGARDLLAIRNTLNQIPEIRHRLAELPLQPSLISQARDELHELPELTAEISRTLQEEPPLSLTEGGLIRAGVDPELDELRRVSAGGKQWLLEYEAAEKEKTGITGLKVRFNRVFGYYIEVTKRNLELVPEHYIRRQTLTNADRFITPELKEYEEKILGAEEKINALEYRLFLELRERAAGFVAELRESAVSLSRLDVLASLAEIADDCRYCRPELVETPCLEIDEGRHPVIETLTPDFVPNDTRLSADSERIWIITGPNMAGKSTFLRQNGLFVLLAQMGSFVPATRARLGLFTQIFTRIGASDNLSRGLSTFMVEMTETARILHQADERSLIILDEIGRGTSTFDGLSLAWAIAEEICEKHRSLTLFATHYHELTELELFKPAIRNYNVTVSRQQDRITFLHRISPGATNHSYGIEVASLAGLPETVIERARVILENLEAAGIAVGGGRRATGGKPKVPCPQNKSEAKKERKTRATRHPGSDSGRPSGYLPLLEPPPADTGGLTAAEKAALNEIAGLLKKTDPNRTTPIRALQLLDRMRKMLLKGG